MGFNKVLLVISSAGKVVIGCAKLLPAKLMEARVARASTRYLRFICLFSIKTSPVSQPCVRRQSSVGKSNSKGVLLPAFPNNLAHRKTLHRLDRGGLTLAPVSFADPSTSPFGKPPCPGRQVGEGVSPSLDAMRSQHKTTLTLAQDSHDRFGVTRSAISHPAGMSRSGLMRVP